MDAQDTLCGHAGKAEVHQGDGRLHRAFSVFLFDGAGRVLLQERAAGKPLWPLQWSNSCCSHPRRGETDQAAVERRLREELAVRARLRFLYKFEYHARYGAAGSEHELCWVWAARSDDPVRANPREVARWEWVAPDELDRRLADQPERHTPWLRLEWPRIRAGHWPEVIGLA